MSRRRPTRSTRLDIHVGKCDIDVVTSNVGDERGDKRPTFFPPSEPVFPPALASKPVDAPIVSLSERVKEVAGLDRGHLERAKRADLERVLEDLVGALKNQSSTELEESERHDDGSLRISSHLAVWLIGKVTDVCGRQLVKLSRIPSRENLHSIAGLANLLTDAIARTRKG